MSLQSITRIRELYNRIAVYLSSTDASNLSQALYQPFDGYETHLMQPWRDYFTTISWTGTIIETLREIGLDAEVLVVGPHTILPMSLLYAHDYSAHRKELRKKKLPYLNIYVLLEEAPLLSFKSIQALESQLSWLMHHLNCTEAHFFTGNCTLQVVQCPDSAPLVRYCIPSHGRAPLLSRNPLSHHKPTNPPSMGYIMVTRDNIKFSTAERVNCYNITTQNIYITVGGFRGDRVDYATFEISRASKHV